MKIKINKLIEEVKIPVRAHYNDAGLDCYALDTVELAGFGEEGYKQMIPLGFAIEVPDGYMATIRPRSSMNAKGLLTQIGTIDSGYRGEIKVIIINLNKEKFVINRGDKLCQIVIEPVILAEFVEDLNNDRGAGGFGSTGQ